MADPTNQPVLRKVRRGGLLGKLVKLERTSPAGEVAPAAGAPPGQPAPAAPERPTPSPPVVPPIPPVEQQPPPALEQPPAPVPDKPPASPDEEFRFEPEVPAPAGDEPPVFEPQMFAPPTHEPHHDEPSAAEQEREQDTSEWVPEQIGADHELGEPLSEANATANGHADLSAWRPVHEESEDDPPETDEGTTETDEPQASEPASWLPVGDEPFAEPIAAVAVAPPIELRPPDDWLPTDEPSAPEASLEPARLQAVEAYCRDYCERDAAQAAALLAVDEFNTGVHHHNHHEEDNAALLHATRRAAASYPRVPFSAAGWRARLTRSLSGESREACLQTSMLLAARANGEINAKELSELRAHLETCRECPALEGRMAAAAEAFNAALSAAGIAPVKVIEPSVEDEAAAPAEEAVPVLAASGAAAAEDLDSTAATAPVHFGAPAEEKRGLRRPRLAGLLAIPIVAAAIALALLLTSGSSHTSTKPTPMIAKVTAPAPTPSIASTARRQHHKSAPHKPKAKAKPKHKAPAPAAPVFQASASQPAASGSSGGVVGSGGSGGGFSGGSSGGGGGGGGTYTPPPPSPPPPSSGSSGGSSSPTFVQGGSGSVGSTSSSGQGIGSGSGGH